MIAIVTAGVMAAPIECRSASRSLVSRPIPVTAASRPAASIGEKVIYPFSSLSGGSAPVASLIADSSGAFYGTTQYGGAKNFGTVFKLTPVGGGYTENTLYSFEGGSDGAYPVAGLLLDSSGALYGTSAAGGACAIQTKSGCGTVFRLAPAGAKYRESVLYRFQGGTGDGLYPMSSVISDTQGSLYGTTSQGGLGGVHAGITGYGTVFMLKRSGTQYSEHLLYRFRSILDGANPKDGDGLLADATGALYGTTEYGAGGYDTCGLGCGSVFRLTPAGSEYHERVLHTFLPGRGIFPTASLIVDRAGTLYGTTIAGGEAQLGQWGVVFTLAPSGAYNVIYDGAQYFNSYSRLVPDATGALYGTTPHGGRCQFDSTSCGTVFKLTPVGSAYSESVLYSFRGSDDGAYPYASLLAGSHRQFFGTTSGGGSMRTGPTGSGTVFTFAP